MNISKTNITAHAGVKVATAVGPNKDNYFILSKFKEDLKTNKLTVKHTVIKNWRLSKQNTVLHNGPYSECVSLIWSIVNKEGEGELLQPIKIN